MSKIKDKLRAGSDRNFLARDFESLRSELIQQARVFFPDKIRDFSEPSVGGLLVDIAASIGDTMSFYLDHQFRELDPSTAVEVDNVIRHLRNAGMKIPGAAPSTVNITLTIKVPAISDTASQSTQPKPSCLPIILQSTTLEADNGVIFNLTEDVDFSKKNVLGEYECDINYVDFSDDGTPLNAVLTKQTIAVSGEEILENITVGPTHVPFRTITLGNPNVSEIISVKDANQNEYYEVESLSQDTVFVAIDNTSRSDFDLVPKTLEVRPAPRRFTSTSSLTTRKTTLQFGSGRTDFLDDDVIPDPSELSLNLYGKKSFSKFAIDPNALLNTQTLGLSPKSTTLTIHYRSGGGLRHNVDASTIKTVKNLNINFSKNPSPTDALSVRQSLKCINPTQARGAANPPSLEELRPLVFSARNSQMRTVTRDDLLSRIYTMPSEFGRVFRVGLNPSQTNPLSLTMSILSLDNNSNLSISPDQLKINLSTYLNEFRLISDAIDIVDGSIINYAIKYEILVDSSSNKQVTIQNVNARIADGLKINLFQVDQPIIIDDIINIIINTPSVISLTDFRLAPVDNILGPGNLLESTNQTFGGSNNGPGRSINGRVYSSFSFPFEASTKNGIIRGPAGSIFELKFPDHDIIGIAI